MYAKYTILDHFCQKVRLFRLYVVISHTFLPFPDPISHFSATFFCPAAPRAACKFHFFAAPRRVPRINFSAAPRAACKNSFLAAPRRAPRSKKIFLAAPRAASEISIFLTRRVQNARGLPRAPAWGVIRVPRAAACRVAPRTRRVHPPHAVLTSAPYGGLVCNYTCICVCK